MKKKVAILSNLFEKIVRYHYTSINTAHQDIKPNLVRTLVTYLALGCLIGILFYSSGALYLMLIAADLTSLTPVTWIMAFWQAGENSNTHPATFYLLGLSLLIPLTWGYMGYRCLHSPMRLQYFKKWLLVTTILLLWLALSNAFLNALTTHTFMNFMASLHPLAYLVQWALVESANLSHLLMAGLLGLVPLLFIGLFFLPSSIPNIYGNAHFATLKEIAKAGLFNKSGLLLGQAYHHDILIPGHEHSIVFAPSGSGKTICLVIPNLLMWSDSCIVIDLKLSLFKLTAGYRVSLGQHVFFWHLTAPDGKTHCYNPLDMISNNPHTRIDDIQKIAHTFIPDNPKMEPIWQAQARYLLMGLILYVLDTPSVPTTFSAIVQLVKQQPDFSHYLQTLLNTREDLDPICRANFLKFCELNEKTRLSILANFLSYFELFENPLIAAATSRSDFDIRELRRKPMTIYIGVTPDNLERLAPLISIFYQQVASVMTQHIPQKDEPYSVLFLIDEFAALKRMEDFKKNIGLFREYQIRVMLIVQELSQLYDTYGREGAKIFINAKTRIAFTQTDMETCALLESMLGSRTIVVKNKSKDKHGNTYENSHYVARPLLLKHEIAHLPKDKALILIEGMPAIYANKIPWYKKKFFLDRILPPPTLPSSVFLPETKQQQISEIISTDQTPNLTTETYHQTVRLDKVL